MKMNSLLSEILQGEWLLDVSGGKSIAYSELALKIIAGEKIEIQQEEVKSIVSLYDEKAQKVNIKENLPEETYGLVKMSGEVIKNGNYCFWGADEIVDKLELLNNNPKVKGIIFYIDSPGGSVSAAGVFQSFKKKKQKPIIALVDLCCSLGYLAAVEVADKIFADNTFSSTIGSIGVVSSFIAPTDEYYEERNLKLHHILPDESKDKNKNYLEAQKGNYDLIKKNMLSPMAKEFQKIVKKARPNLVIQDGVLTGSTYLAKDAKKLGLIDGFADIEKCIQTIKFINSLK